MPPKAPVPSTSIILPTLENWYPAQSIPLPASPPLDAISEEAAERPSDEEELAAQYAPFCAPPRPISPKAPSVEEKASSTSPKTCILRRNASAPTTKRTWSLGRRRDSAGDRSRSNSGGKRSGLGGRLRYSLRFQRWKSGIKARTSGRALGGAGGLQGLSVHVVPDEEEGEEGRRSGTSSSGSSSSSSSPSSSNPAAGKKEEQASSAAANESEENNPHPQHPPAFNPTHATTLPHDATTAHPPLTPLTPLTATPLTTTTNTTAPHPPHTPTPRALLAAQFRIPESHLTRDRPDLDANLRPIHPLSRSYSNGGSLRRLRERMRSMVPTLFSHRGFAAAAQEGAVRRSGSGRTAGSGGSVRRRWGRRRGEEGERRESRRLRRLDGLPPVAGEVRGGEGEEGEESEESSEEEVAAPCVRPLGVGERRMVLD